MEVYADLWLVGLGGLGALAVALVGLHELAHWVKRDFTVVLLGAAVGDLGVAWAAGVASFGSGNHL